MSESTVIALPSDVTIMDVEQLQAQLQQQLAAETALVVNAQYVQRIDTAALQLLASFLLSCQQQHRTVQWQTPSEIFLKSARLLGLGTALALSEN